MKQIFTSSVLAMLTAIIIFLTIPMVEAAQGRLPDEYKKPIEKVSEFQEPVKGEDSTEMLNNLIKENIIPIVKFIFIAVGLLFIGLYAYQMSIGMGDDEQLSGQKSNLIFAALGFTVMTIALQLSEIIDPNREGDTSTFLDKDATDILIRDLINYIELGLGAIAIAVIFYGGMRMITANGDEERVTEGKNILMYGFLGFVIVMLAKPLITKVFYPKLGSQNIGQDQAKTFIEEGLGVLEFLLTFLGVIIFIAFIYAAFMFLLAGIDEEKKSTAINTLIWTAIGFIIVLISYSIVMFFLPGN